MPPVYDYRCDSGHEFEREQKILDVPLATCPCLGTDHEGREVTCCSPCRRLISRGTGFTLKGGGWAKDGYK